MPNVDPEVAAVYMYQNDELLVGYAGHAYSFLHPSSAPTRGMRAAVFELSFREGLKEKN